MKSTVLPFSVTKERLLCLASSYKGEYGTTLLFSGGTFDSAQKSYLCLFPIETLLVKSKEITHSKSGKTRSYTFDNPWEGLKTYITPNSKLPIPDWVGYFSYEMGSFSDEHYEFSVDTSEIPDAYFMRFEIIIEVEHKTNKAVLYTQSDHVKSLQIIENSFNNEKNLNFKRSQSLEFSYKSDSFESYEKKISKAKEYLYAGDIYQVNLSQQFKLEGEIDPYETFRHLAEINPAPYSAFLNLGTFSVISSSPEKFLDRRDNFFETRPIKGTAPRSDDPYKDALIKNDLLTSEKEKAELLMITDLLRNDLGKISVPGTVKVEKLWACEAYSNVHHMLSVIKSHCVPDLHPVDAVRACFPGGSITGCPKLRAMEIISELEKRPRGLYTGSVGYFAQNGDFDFNIAIRTFIYRNNSVDVQLGGAITLDSDPKNEFEETLHKGRSIFQSLNS